MEAVMRWWTWIVAGCSAPASPILETTTDGGTWTIGLLEGPTEAGDQVLTADLAPANAAITSVVASMPDMGHASDAAIGDEGNGRFTLGIDLVMAGWWVLDGAVSDGTTEEGFRLELEVP